MKFERKTYFNFKIASTILLSSLIVFSFDLGLHQILPKTAYHSEWIFSDSEDTDFSFSIEKKDMNDSYVRISPPFIQFDFRTFLFCFNLIQNVDYQLIKLKSKSIFQPSLFLKVYFLSRNFGELSDCFLA